MKLSPKLNSNIVNKMTCDIAHYLKICTLNFALLILVFTWVGTFKTKCFKQVFKTVF